MLVKAQELASLQSDKLAGWLASELAAGGRVSGRGMIILIGAL